MSDLIANQKFDERFMLVERIGYGGFSEVWKAQRKNGFVQALKIFIRMDARAVKLAQDEFERSFDLNHPNILQASDFKVFNNRPYLVMPYCANGSALKQIGKLSELQIAKVMMDIGSALTYVHGREEFLIHQDVKPDNFLIDSSGNYLLSDFGISEKLKTRLSVQAHSSRPTQTRDRSNGDSGGFAPPSYRPPETFDKEFLKRQPVKASDIWAFGASLFELATGQLPFNEYGGVIQQSTTVIPDLPKDKFSNELNFIIRKCLSKETWDRPTANELVGYARNFLKKDEWGANIVPDQPPPNFSNSPSPSKNSNNKHLIKYGALVGSLALLVLLFFIVRPFESEGQRKLRVWKNEKLETLDCLSAKIDDIQVIRVKDSVKENVKDFQSLLNGLGQDGAPDDILESIDIEMLKFQNDLSEKYQLNVNNC